MTEQNSNQTHPEAEILVAFAEKNLTTHERESVLMHLADCAACREILFLTQFGLPEEESTAAAAPASATRARWLTWRAITITACLLLTVGVMTQQIYQRTHSTNETVAQSTPAPLPQPATSNPVSNTSISPSVVPPAHSQVPMSAAPHDLDAAAKAPQHDEAKPTLPQNFKAVTSSSLMGAEHPVTSNESVSLHQLQQEHSGAITTNENASHLTTINASQLTVNPSPTPKMAMRKMDAPAPPASASGGVFGSAPQMTESANQTVDVSAAAPNLIGTESAERTKLTLLPSGQSAHETVTIAGNLLALDQSGHLYSSADQGVTWHEIHKQWSGNATTLAMVPHLTNNDADKSRASAFSSGGYAVVLLNSVHQEWISTDGGLTWKPNAK